MIRTRLDKKGEVVARATPVDRQKVDYKPLGLWYSVDGDWERWCASEQPDWLEGLNVHAVTLGDEKMCEIRTTTEIDLFHREYRSRLHPTIALEGIDWKRVAADYDGIEIAPYIWKRRLDGEAHAWYYGWDCASGCIWRPRGVTLVLCETATNPSTGQK